MACKFSQEFMSMRPIRSNVNARILPNAHEAEKARKVLTLQEPSLSRVFCLCHCWGVLPMAFQNIRSINTRMNCSRNNQRIHITRRGTVSAVSGVVLPLLLTLTGIPSDSAWAQTLPTFLNAGDYVMFSQARDGKARETSSNGSNDAQASVSGSDNGMFGRIRSNGDFSSSGQNIYYHYIGNGPIKPVPPSTVNDGKITFRFINENGDNFYETPLSDPRHPGFTDGTWKPIQSDVPVGPVGVVPTVPPGDEYQFWPGDLNTTVTASSNYLEMDVLALEPVCDFGSLLGGSVEFDLNENSPNGTYCTNGGLIKLSAQDVGSETNPKKFTFLANDGLITISGQNARIEPFALGLLAMTDLPSFDDQFPIKISGSDFKVQSQSILFASRSGVDVSGSNESLLCTHAIGQEAKLQGSTTDFGPLAPGCLNPLISVVKTQTLTNDSNGNGLPDVGDVVTYSYTVTNTGTVPLFNVSLVDDIEGVITLSDVAGDGVSVLEVGDSETGTAAHTITQAEFESGTLTNIVTASGTSPSGTDVQDTDTQTIEFVPAPTIDLVKTQALTTDNNLNGLPDVGDVVTYNYTVTNTGDVNLSGVTLVDDVEGTIILSDAALDGIGNLAVGDTETGSAAHLVTQAEFDAGSLTNIATVTGTDAEGQTVQDTDTQTVNFAENPAIDALKELTGNADEDTSGTVSLGDTLTYTITATNISDVTLSNVTVDDDLTGTVDAPCAASLAPGGSCSVALQYVVTQADVDAGQIDNTGTVEGTPPSGPPVVDDDPETVPAPQNPAIGVIKSQALTSDGNLNGLADAGDVVTYSYVVTNTGDVTLSSVALVDDVEGVLTLSDAAGDGVGVLAVGDSETASSAHTVTQAEFDAGSLTNIATATGNGPQGQPVQDTDTQTVSFAENPAIDALKELTGNADEDTSGTVSVGDTLTYTITATNISDVTLSNVTVDDDLTGTVDAPCAASLAPGGSCSVALQYVVTQADVDAGQIDNTGTVEGTPPSGPPVVDDDPETVPAPQNPAIDVIKSQALTSDSNLNGLADAGDVVTYSYVVTNTGDVTLSSVALVDDVEGVLTLSDAAGDGVGVLAVGDSETASSAHTVTQAEFDAGSLTNIATATGNGPQGQPVQDTDTQTVSFAENPAIDALKELTGNADEDTSGTVSVGDTLTYTITATNIGDVTLSNVTVDDDLTGTVDAPCAASLAPGGSCSVALQYVVTQADVDAGQIDNTGTVEGTPPSGPPVVDDDPETVPAPQNPAIDVIKSQALTSDSNLNGLADAGDVVTYSYVVTNTGDVTLSSVLLSDDVEGPISLSDVAGDGVGVLAVGDSETGSSAHTVTQAEFDASSLTNVATATGQGPQGQPVQNTDTQTVSFAQNPAIAVVKSQALTTDGNLNGLADVGDVVTYSYVVTNTGDVTLSSVSLSDDVEGAITLSDVAGDGVGVLAVGDSETGSSAHTVTQAEFDADTLTNIATASGQGPQGQPVQDTDTQTVSFAQNPAIAVVKSQALTTDSNLNGLADAGDVVTYSYVVTNTGDVTLSSVSLSDDVEGAITLSDVAGDGVGVLAVGDSETGSSAHTVTQAEFDAGTLTNIATASGQGPQGQPVQDTDTQTVSFAQNPAIAVVKSQALTTDGNLNGLADVGDVVTYSYVVTNTGDVTLSNVSLSDDVEGAITLSDVAGDGVGVLAVGDSETGSSAHTVTQAEFDAASLTNIATATGNGPQGQPVQDTDTQTVSFTQNPAIQVVKSQALTTDSNLNGLPDVGDVVTYSYVVTNTGDVTLSSVSLGDDVEGAITLSDVAGDGVGVLAVGDSETGSSAHTVTQAEFDAGTLTNIATASGQGPQGQPVQDTDTQTVNFAQNPAIAVVKSQALTTDSNLNGLADAGDVVTYSYVVTNTGDVTLSSVSLSDDVEGPISLSDAAGDGVGVLAVGDSETGSSAHTVTQAEFDASSLTNVATATGQGPQGQPVQDTDTQTVSFAQNPAIAVVKSQALTTDGNLNGLADVGDVVTYSYVVTNTGDVTLSSVSLSDDVEGAITLSDVAGNGVGVLAVGDSETGSSAHTVTQAEFDADTLTNIATASGQGPQGQPVQDTDTQTVSFAQNPAIAVVKSQALTTDSNLNGLADAGDVVTYSYVVTNTGDVTLSSVSLSDDVEGAITLSDVAGDGVGVLAVGDSETGSSAHTVTQAEFDAGTLTNIATASGQGPQGQPVQDTDTQTVTFAQNPAIQVVKSQTLTTDANGNGAPDLGDVITYNFTVTNIGDVTLTDVVVTDPLPGLSTPIPTAGDGDSDGDVDTLVVNGVATFTATYAITQADINAGSLTNVATATGTPPTGPPVTDTDTETVKFVNLSLTKTSAVSQVTSTLSNSATVTASNGSPASASKADTVVVASDISYTLTVTNSGDADATGVVITDTLPLDVAVTANPDAGIVAGNSITWNIGTVVAGGSATVSVTVQTQNP